MTRHDIKAINRVRAVKGLPLIPVESDGIDEVDSGDLVDDNLTGGLDPGGDSVPDYYGAVRLDRRFR